MPGKLLPIIFLRERMIKFMVKPHWIEPKPVYAASFLVLIAGLLLVTVIAGLQQAPYVTVVPSAPPQLSVEIAAPEPASVAPAKNEAAADKAEVTVKPTEEKAVLAVQAAVIDPKESAVAAWLHSGEIVREYGWQLHPVYKDWRYSSGVDILRAADQKVPAVLDGKVVSVERDKNNGLTVVIQSGGYKIYYGSLADSGLATGASVHAGDRIGTVGHSPSQADPHLYLAVQKEGKFINPRDLL